MRRCACLLLLLTATAASAQSTTPAAVTFDDVLAQVKAGTQPGDVLANSNVIFTLSPAQQQALLQAGATPALIDGLQAKRIPIGDVTDFVVILDCSGSMKDEIAPGQTKMDAAKKVLGELFQAIPNGRNVGFVVYGDDVAKACKSVRTVRPLGTVNAAAKAELTAAVAALQPGGHTPIAASLLRAGELLAGNDQLSQVVVVTDGLETCHGDPAAEAETLAKSVKGLRGVAVVGVGLKTQEEKDGVALIARRGRGKFYSTDSAAELKKAISEAVPQVDVPPAKPIDQPATLSARDKVFIMQLRDASPEVRRDAADALAKQKSRAPEVADALAARVADGLWTWQASGCDNIDGKTSKDAAYKALVALAPGRAEAALVAATQAKSEQAGESETDSWETQMKVRRWAARTLGTRTGDKPVGDSALSPGTAALIELLKDGHPDVRFAAAKSLEARKEKAKEAIDALADRVADDVWTVTSGCDNLSGRTSKDGAYEALKALAPGRVEDALIKAAGSKTAEVKSWATKKLTS